MRATFGILCALGASTCFSLNDMGIKLLSGAYPLHQIVLIRSLIGITITLAIMVPLDGGWEAFKTKRIGMHVIRAATVIFANTVFFMGLAALPISEATAIFFIAPLVITAFAFLFLAEKAGPRRWAAVCIGMVGVLIIIRPGSDAFRLAALLPVAAAFAYATLHVLTRKIGATERASTMSIYIQMTFIVVSATVGLTVGDGRFSGGAHPSIEFLLRAWSWPPMADWPVLAMVGVASGFGGYLISQAYRQSEASLIAPFEYVAMPMAIIWGITLFGEFPDALAWLGINLIIGAGLYVFWREAVNSRKVAGRKPIRR